MDDFETDPERSSRGDPSYAEECSRQARLIRDAETPESLAEDQLWCDSADFSGWTE
ncbi:MAG: hypothetical protein H7Z10_02425 [Gemmatimonadaceae bacterium]|nr:hypothetical protein [Acetobacteraceae bacterium]